MEWNGMEIMNGMEWTNYLECWCQLEEVANDEVDPILDTIDSGIVARVLDLLRVDIYGYHMEVPAHTKTKKNHHHHHQKC